VVEKDSHIENAAPAEEKAVLPDGCHLSDVTKDCLILLKILVQIFIWNLLKQWFLTCGEWRSCQVGNNRSDSRTTASKFNTSHPNVDLLYKSQPFTEEMESWPTKKWGIGEKRL